MRLIRIAFCLGLAMCLNPAFARNQASEILSALATQKNIGPEVVSAFSKTDKVRVFVAMHDPRPRQAMVSQTVDERRAGIARARMEVLSAVPPDGFELLRKFINVSGFAGMASPRAVAAMAGHPLVWRVDIDAGGSGNLVQGLALSSFNVPRNLGYSGEGVTVAIVDSGYDSDHPDLADSLVAEQCFCGDGCCPAGSATQSGAGAAEDDNGHGTNVAGIITGNGTVAPEGGAPDADIVAIKVLDSSNRFCCASDITAALDWIISSAPDVDLVNMSLGTDALFAGNCDAANALTAQAIDTLKAQGIPVFVSSGNNGSGTKMQAPACIANAISVGAVWDSDVGRKTVLGCTDITTQADQVTCFSNSSTTTDIFAAGAPITSTGMGGAISTYFGTSQASPMVAACAALLLQELPGLAPSALEASLKRTNVMVTDLTNGLNFPRLNCALALEKHFSDGFEGQ